MKQETFFVMSYNEFDKLVRTNFPKHQDFSFVEKEECGNDTDHAFTRIGIPIQWKPDTDPAQIAKWQQDEIDNFEKWINGEKVIGFGIAQILEGMIHKGLLEAGNYLIRVSW